MAKQTVETRWFFQSAPLSPEALFGMYVPPMERTDWYAFPCHRSTGLKFREGRLETKLLIEDCGLQTWRHVTGNVESWKKWIAEYSGDLPSRAVFASTGWVEVHKSRHWQVLDMAADDLHWCAQRVPHGCEVEWSEVTVAGQVWWTVGFEAVGLPAVLQENLRRAIVFVLGKEDVNTPFCAENSLAYPAWLWKVRTGGGMLPSEV
jgi:hypothetical protein